jgi:hypothetical protein
MTPSSGRQGCISLHARTGARGHHREDVSDVHTADESDEHKLLCVRAHNCGNWQLLVVCVARRETNGRLLWYGWIRMLHAAEIWKKIP